MKNLFGPTSVEICAGVGGQALGLEAAGFQHSAVVEIDPDCCASLRLNRPDWRVFEEDVGAFARDNATQFRGVDLLAGGLPCPPFSIAGKQLGELDERNLFPVAIKLIELIRPRAVMLENVRGFLDAVFEDFRGQLVHKLKALGYQAEWRLLNASDFGVPQLRPRVVIVALSESVAPHFSWPAVLDRNPQTVGAALVDLMRTRGWRGATAWERRANEIAPTIVGGSKKHGGPDLGPTRSRAAWASLGVDGRGIVDEAPSRDFVGMPRLTVRMVARLQGFADGWQIAGKKTAAYRQVGNAFPPPVAAAVGERIRFALAAAGQQRVRKAS